MGLDVSVSLVVGVPLLKLGKIITEDEIIETTDNLGRKTGQSVTLTTAFLETEIGKRECGSNERSLLSTYSSGRISYNFVELVNDDEDWIHVSDYEGGPDQVVIGLEPTVEKGAELDRFETFEYSKIQSIEDIKSKVTNYLNKEFGYTEDVYVIAICHYSY